MAKTVSSTKIASLKKCNGEQDDLVYFTFYPLTIFCFFLASDKFLLVDVSLYSNDVVIAITVCQVLTHEFCLNVIIIAVFEVYRSNLDRAHRLCHRPRVLELNSLLATISICALSASATFGALDTRTADDLTSYDVGIVAMSFWIISKLILLSSLLYMWYVISRSKS